MPSSHRQKTKEKIDVCINELTCIGQRLLEVREWFDTGMHDQYKQVVEEVVRTVDAMIDVLSNFRDLI